MDPVSALIGSVLFGLGTILLYGALKNKRVFGEKGIIPQALATGSVTKLADVPAAFPSSKLSGVGSAVADAASAGISRVQQLQKIQSAIAGIEAVDSGLAREIRVRVFLVTADSTREDLMPLAQLLAIADRKNLSSSTSVIREYIQELTGESI